MCEKKRDDCEDTWLLRQQLLQHLCYNTFREPRGRSEAGFACLAASSRVEC
jgi:hypothetical protein